MDINLGWDALKREMTIMAVPSGAQANIRGHFAFDIAIDGIEVLRGQPAVSVLDAMYNEVRNCLIATEAKCRSLGFDLGT